MLFLCKKMEEEENKTYLVSIIICKFMSAYLLISSKRNNG